MNAQSANSPLLESPARRLLFAGLTLAALGLVSLGLSGCRVGPKYVAAAPPPPAPAYKESLPRAYAGTDNGTWKPAAPSDAMLKGKWWEVFHEPELNALEEQLNINNQNIAVYFQNFMAARAIVSEARSGLFPTLGVSPSYTRQKSAGALRGTTATTTTGTGTGGTGTGTTTATSSGTTSTVLSLPFDVSWEPDLWGKVRNTVLEQQNAAQVSAATLENERLSEQADLAAYFFELRGQDALQDLYNRTIVADQKTLDLTRALYEAGIDDQESVAQAEVTLANTQATAVGIATNRALYEHAIATLIGKPASSFSMPVKSLATPVPSIPLGVPSQLLQRRPDIAAAERTMAEANALIGVETAAYYPSLSLTGSGGLESSAIGTLFSAPALFWSAGASASETIFEGGLRRATVAQYRAQYDADTAAYKQTVLTAFQQVEDYLSTLRITSDQILHEKTAVAAAQHYLDLATARYETGLDPYLNVITAQTTLLADQQSQVSLEVQEMTAAVQLIQALGGGWDTTQLPSATAINTPAGLNTVRNTP
jgi:NodT family efflux transporter outer membrane factor (OMF) lipoprotein